jgi:hypothetical protein
VYIGEGWASRRPGVTVGHTHRRSFLQRLDVSEPRIVLQYIQQRRLAGARVPEDKFGAFGDKHLGQGIFPGHLGHGGYLLFLSNQLSAVSRSSPLLVFQVDHPL